MSSLVMEAEAVSYALPRISSRSDSYTKHEVTVIVGDIFETSVTSVRC